MATDPRTCGHCGRTPPLGTGFADSHDLCHTGTIPADADPPDCYRQVTVYGHAADGSCCRAPKPSWLAAGHAQQALIRDSLRDLLAASIAKGR